MRDHLSMRLRRWIIAAPATTDLNKGVILLWKFSLMLMSMVLCGVRRISCVKSLSAFMRLRMKLWRPHSLHHATWFNEQFTSYRSIKRLARRCTSSPPC